MATLKQRDGFKKLNKQKIERLSKHQLDDATYQEVLRVESRLRLLDKHAYYLKMRGLGAPLTYGLDEQTLAEALAQYNDEQACANAVDDELDQLAGWIETTLAAEDQKKVDAAKKIQDQEDSIAALVTENAQLKQDLAILKTKSNKIDQLLADVENLKKAK